MSATTSHFNTLALKLPQGHTFADLKLRRCDDSAIDLDMDLVKQVCELNHIDVDKVLADPGPFISTLLSVWYKAHLRDGGAPDPVMQSLLAVH